jgi:hypothetical protein
VARVRRSGSDRAARDIERLTRWAAPTARRRCLDTGPGFADLLLRVHRRGSIFSSISGPVGVFSEAGQC